MFFMMKCHLSTLMGKKKVRIADVSRDLDINRGTITRLYEETASRVELDVIEKLCQYFDCSVCELFEIIDNET